MARTTNRALNRMLSKLTNQAATSAVLLTRAARPSKNGQPGRIPIRGGHCSGCNVRIPSGHLQRALAGKIIQCERCLLQLYVEKDSV